MNAIQTEWDIEHLAEDAPQAPAWSTDDPLPPDMLAMIGYLHVHARGPEHIVTAKAIADFLGLEGSDPARYVRHLIELHLERFPFVLVGVPGHGYYITESPDDMAHYDAMLFSLLQAAARKIGAFRRLAAFHGYRRTGHAPHTYYTSPLRRQSPCRIQPFTRGIPRCSSSS